MHTSDSCSIKRQSLTELAAVMFRVYTMEGGGSGGVVAAAGGEVCFNVAPYRV